MAYSDTVSAFKEALNGYSEEENKIKELYKSARERNEAAKSQAIAQLDSKHSSDRNAAFADNARAELNTARMLNSRGLGFSGEMAQSKLNSNLSLSSRLGELASANTVSRQALIDKHDGYAHELALEEAEKRALLRDGKSKLLADVAKAELENEQKEKEIELGYAKIEAEKELLQAELDAKYKGEQGFTAGNVGNGTDNVDNGTADTETPDTDASVFFSPEIKPKDLARLMVQNATGNDYIKSERDTHLVNKYLLQAIEDYKLSDAYMEELIFMLKAYGLKELSHLDLRKSVISTDAKSVYDTNYEKRYKEYIDRGTAPSRARTFAQYSARTDAFDYIYSHTNSKAEFLECCELIKLDYEEAKKYASDKSFGIEIKSNGQLKGVSGVNKIIRETK